MKLAYGDEVEKHEAWGWLQENCLLEEQCGNAAKWSAVDAAFRLLQACLLSSSSCYVLISLFPRLLNLIENKIVVDCK